MKGISLKAIVVAVVAALSLDVIFGIALIVILGGPSFGPEWSDEQFNAALDVLTASQAFLVWSALLGTLSTLVGGYIAARFSESLPYMNAFVFGMLGLILGMLTADGLPLWFNVVGFVSVVPAALLGGHLAKRGNTYMAGGPRG